MYSRSNSVLRGNRTLVPSNMENRRRLDKTLGTIGTQGSASRIPNNYPRLNRTVRNRAANLERQMGKPRAPMLPMPSRGMKPMRPPAYQSPSRGMNQMRPPAYQSPSRGMNQMRPANRPNGRNGLARYQQIQNSRLQMANKIRQLRTKQNANRTQLANVQAKRKANMNAINQKYAPTIANLNRAIKNGNATMRSVQKQINSLSKSKNYKSAKRNMKAAMGQPVTMTNRAKKFFGFYKPKY